MFVTKFFRKAEVESERDFSSGLSDFYLRLVEPGGDLFNKILSMCNFGFKPVTSMPSTSDEEVINLLSNLKKDDCWMYNSNLIQNIISYILAAHFKDLLDNFAVKFVNPDGTISYRIEDNTDFVRAGVALVNKYFDAINKAGSFKIKSFVDPANENNYKKAPKPSESKELDMLYKLENLSKEEKNIIDTHYGAIVRQLESLGNEGLKKLYNIKTMKELAEFYLSVDDYKKKAIEVILDYPKLTYPTGQSHLALPILSSFIFELGRVKDIGKIFEIALQNYGIDIIERYAPQYKTQVNYGNFWKITYSNQEIRSFILSHFKDSEFENFLWGGRWTWHKEKLEKSVKGIAVFKTEDDKIIGLDIEDKAAQEQVEQSVSLGFVEEKVLNILLSNTPGSLANQLVNKVEKTIEDKIIKDVQRRGSSKILNIFYSTLLRLPIETIQRLANALQIITPGQFIDLSKKEFKQKIIDSIYQSVSTKLQNNLQEISASIISEINELISNKEKNLLGNIGILVQDRLRNIISNSVLAIWTPKEIEENIIHPMLGPWLKRLVDELDIKSIIEILLSQSTDLQKIISTQKLTDEKSKEITDIILDILEYLGFPKMELKTKIFNEVQKFIQNLQKNRR